MSEKQSSETPDTPPGSATQVQHSPPLHLLVDKLDTSGETVSGSSPGFAETDHYRLLKEIARGGMGVVYLARDLVLNRDVGLKTLLKAPTEGSQIASRFREEARISGQLQHPNIPPVHELGTLRDGRPFLAMKLIKGQTLDAMLEARPDLSHEPGRYLAIFEQIAQGVAYAHAHRVIHRDLKPLNIMVGAFGEVQVMDWGLAKVLTDSSVKSTPLIAPPPATDIQQLRDESNETRAGSVFGTPAYMPREQAIGAVDQIDTRSDVFALGAVLCTILTGKPPYIGPNSESTRQLAAIAKLDDALNRLDSCGAEPDLVALCKHCLTPEPDNRPHDAGEVAKAIAKLRAEAEQRARQAELDRVRAETERAAADARAAEQRRKRRWQLVAAGAVILLLSAVGLFAWHENQKAIVARNEAEIRRVAVDREVEAAVAEKASLCERGEGEIGHPARWALTLASARSACRRAEAALGSGEASGTAQEQFRLATTRLVRDEGDCATAALCEDWFVSLFSLMANEPGTEDFIPLAERIRTLLARIGMNLGRDSPDALAASVRSHHLQYPLTAVLTLGRAPLNEDRRPAIQAEGEVLTKAVALLLQAYDQTAKEIDAILKPPTRDPDDWDRDRDHERFLAYLNKIKGRFRTVDLVGTYLHVADTGLELQSTSGVEALLDEAIERSPNDIIPLFLRATTVPGYSFRFYALGPSIPNSDGRRIAACAAAVSLRPDLPELWSLYGSSLAKAGLWDWAAQCYARALYINPSRTADYSSRAHCLFESGHYRDALTVYQSVLSRPENLARPGLASLWLEGAEIAMLFATEGEPVKDKQPKGGTGKSQPSPPPRYHFL